MKISRKTTSLFSFIILIGLGLYFTQVQLQNLNSKIHPDSSADGSLSFTALALGGFRGIISDILWLRATNLQAQGKYFELVQLASLINDLQPDLSSTTTFLAWNMAYNISITFEAPENKWRWIRNAINLLQNAINKTPEQPRLYRELAWIYTNKIGQYYDSSNEYYKYYLANNFLRVAKTGYPKWDELENTTINWDTLTKKINGLNNFSESDLVSDYIKEGKINFNPESIYENELLQNYLVRKSIFELYAITPEKANEVERSFGKLNWALYQAHALYWTINSPLKNITNDKLVLTTVKITTDSLLRDGTILSVDESKEEILTGANLNIIKNTFDFYEKLISNCSSNNKEFLKKNYKKFWRDSLMYSQIFAKRELFDYILARGSFFGIDNRDTSNILNVSIAKNFPITNRIAALYQIKKCIRYYNIYKKLNNTSASNGYLELAKKLYRTYQSLNSSKRLPSFSTFLN